MNEEKLIENILREEKVFQRAPAYPIFILAFEETFLHLEKYLGKTYSGLVLRLRDGYGDFCYLKKDLPKVFDAVDKKIKNNPRFLNDFEALYKKQFNEAWINYQKISKKGDIIKTFDSVFNLFMLSVGIGHIIEPTSIVGTHLLKDELTKKIRNMKELSNALNILTTTEKKSFSNEYDGFLAKIHRETGDIKKEKLIERHLKKYYWIKNSYAGSRQLTKGDVLKELKSLRKDSRGLFIKLKNDKREIIKKFKISPSIQNLAKELLFITSWQDERKINILKVISELDKVLHKISDEYKVDLKALYVMMPEEILARKFISLEEVKKRGKCFLWIFDKKLKNNHALLVGDTADRLYKKFSSEKKSDGDILNGMCASTGSAIGTASICKTLNDIKNFKQGNILITSMTRPEYLPTMKKAAAIVTDEGGITCHAAIVSRELGIPCVIGTKNATTVIKNGYLIEVKADHGVVKILKR